MKGIQEFRTPGATLVAAVFVAAVSLITLLPNAGARATGGPATLPERARAVSVAGPLVPVGELPIVRAELGFAPHAAPPVTRDYPAVVEVQLTAEEKVMEIAPGVRYKFWTFNGSVPGPMIRVRVGDMVRLNFRNAHGSQMSHNIDLHAVTGLHGGGHATMTMPGNETGVEFRALKAGTYVYHCATPPVGMHIGNGMYGIIVVEPEGGLAPVDEEFYLMQGEFYTTGHFGEKGLQAFDMERALAEDPTYVVFNGKVGAVAGDHALTAQQGDIVRIFAGNAGPSLISSFHAIGEIFDRVQLEGGTEVNENVQTTLIPAGGATVVEMALESSGTVSLVDHSIFRATGKGAAAEIHVSGQDDPQVFSGQLYNRPFAEQRAETGE